MHPSQSSLDSEAEWAQATHFALVQEVADLAKKLKEYAKYDQVAAREIIVCLSEFYFMEENEPLITIKVPEGYVDRVMPEDLPF